MKKRCADCQHFEADIEDGNDGMGRPYMICNARHGVSNLKQFPFKDTSCLDHEQKEIKAS